MKPTLIYFVVAIALVFGANAYAEPSRQETIDWLTQKLSGYRIVYSNTLPTPDGDSTIEFTYSIRKFTIENGILSFDIEQVSTGPATIPTRHIRLRLAELTSRCVVKLKREVPGSRTDPQLFFITLLTSDSKAGCEIRFTDQELAERVCKAFEHLIKLSGGKEEVF